MTRRVILVSMSLLSTACVAGGGPVAGCYVAGRRGCFAGGEVNGGFAFVQATVGIQHAPAAAYLRVDATADVVGFRGEREPLAAPGARAGLGVAGGDGADVGATFAFGADAGVVLATRGADCSGGFPVGHVGVALRYLRGWAVVVTARVEGHWALCGH